MVLRNGDSLALALSANSSMDVLAMYEDFKTGSNPHPFGMPDADACTVNTGTPVVLGGPPVGFIRRITSLQVRNNGGVSQNVGFVLIRAGASFAFSPTYTVASGKGLVAAEGTTAIIV